MEVTKVNTETVAENYLPRSEAASGFTAASDFDELELQVTAAVEGIASLTVWQAEMLDGGNTKINFCDDLDAPGNGTVETPAEHIPGSTAIFKCDVPFYMDGREKLTCLSTGEWSHEAPTCAGATYGTKEQPGTSCRDIWNTRSKEDSSVPIPDGAYWIKYASGADDSAAVKGAIEVYCDMTTKTEDQKSGWTLCGKLNRDLTGPKYLSQGFGRANIGLAAMGDLYDFRGSLDGQKWASIDCRGTSNSMPGACFNFGG